MSSRLEGALRLTTKVPSLVQTSQHWFQLTAINLSITFVCQHAKDKHGYKHFASGDRQPASEVVQAVNEGGRTW